MNELRNMKIEKKTKKNELRPGKGLTTHCDECRKNCHHPCDCWFSGIGRCTVFGFFSGCEYCGCDKDRHHQDKYYYTYEDVIEEVEDSIETKQKKAELNRQKNNKKKEEYEKEKKKKEEEKKVLASFRERINCLEKEQEIKKKEKEKTVEEREKITKELIIIIIELKNISQKLELIAMNKNHIKTEDEYIDNLKE
jgi:hypothetical protein